MTWGPTRAGFNRPRKEDIIKLIQQDLLSPDGMGPDAPVYDSPLEEIIGVLAAPIAEAWEALEKVYNDFDPDLAEDAALDNLMALIGLTRLGATKTVGGIEIHGTPGTMIPQGFEVKNATTDARYITLKDVIIGPNGNVEAGIEAREFGPIESAPDTAVTVISGVDSIQSVTLSKGRLREEDADARLRRLASLQVLGKGTVGGIRADLLALDFVEAAVVLENDTEYTVNGMAPFSVRAIIYPSNIDAEQKKLVAQTLWQHKGGIYMNGAVEYKVTLDGVEYFVRWDWASDVSIYIEVDLTVSPRADQTTVKDQVKRAIIAAVDKLQVGDDVRKLDIYAAINSVPSVVSADMRMGTAPNPISDDNIVIAQDEVRELYIPYLENHISTI